MTDKPDPNDESIAKSTEELSFNAALIPFNTRAEPQDSLSQRDFVRLPAKPKSEGVDSKKPGWRLKVTSANPEFKPLYLEIYDDVVIGRSTAKSTPDLDLAQYGAARLGVSREHARFSPTDSELLLIDLGSTNGTYANGVRLGSGAKQPLKDKDTLSLSGVHFLVEIISQPKPKLKAKKGDAAPKKA